MSTTTIEQAQHTTETTDWMRLARASAVTMVVWAILLHLSARIVIPPVVVVGLVFAGFIPFLKGERRRLGLAYAIVALLALVGNAPVIIDELIHIDSTPSFVLTLLSVVAASAAIVAGLGAFFRWPTQSIRPIAIAGAAVFVVGSIVSIGGFMTHESAVALEGDTVVVAEKLEFVPEDMTLNAGPTGLLVENKDGIRHTFTIAELDVDLEVPALKSARTDFTAAPGEYTYICTVPGHESMTGRLTVDG
ncbi:MAG: cupredoxin domain-containing protein [Acidimicrobiia bacterium]